MHFFPFILSFIFIVLIILTPFLFKQFLKIKYFSGLGIGVCCVLVFLLIEIVAFIIITFLLVVAIYNTVKNKDNININNKNNLQRITPDIIFELDFSLRFFLLLLSFISNILLLKNILYFINMNIKQGKGFKSIFMFISGFNLFMFSVSYLQFYHHLIQ